MTKRNYFQSLVIFVATAYFVRTVLELHWFETVLLMLLLIVCVFHTMDIRDDIERRKAAKRLMKRRKDDEPPRPFPV